MEKQFNTETVTMSETDNQTDLEVCPSCKSDIDCEGGSFDFSSGEVSQLRSCACGAEWTVYYAVSRRVIHHEGDGVI